ncbi:hypothetical protein [Oceanibacterium hippocampi]|uniref:Uncharacterized protein n=1 Tax=Oceanibacterium hippocampi TaxID=745714 RepID=A0A1Y5TAE9_9PROT|nr:hypothetical protein [Oceanibacterium hippocampi]SLN55949.1 hypothetical protein OCH7691_02408 [Oceanibacterium hippocampi]
MFKPNEILIDAFSDRLRDEYRDVFGSEKPAYADRLAHIGRMALTWIVRSDALYHTIDHAMHVSMVGADILRGRMIADNDVTPDDWLHFIASSLCFAIGFTPGCCPGDSRDAAVIAADGSTLSLPRGATGGILWPYYTDRSQIFVRRYFRDDTVIDAERIAATIDYTRFPPLPDRNLDTMSFPGLLRAAHYIGAIADLHFHQRMTPLFLELDECGLARDLGYHSVADLREKYPTLFWTTLHPLVADGMRLLSHTGQGRRWISILHANVMIEEHSDDRADGVANRR